MPFEEIPHTADISLHVWAPDLPSLFVEAARGMFSLAGAIAAEKPATHRTLNISAPDKESLLVTFLSELVYIAEKEQIIFQEIHIDIDVRKNACKLEGSMMGHPLASIVKTIKAVTFHNLRIQKVDNLHEVTIVFDV
jgi:SHS2 domain-containing protein